MNGRELRAIREARGWTAKQVAAAIYRTHNGVTVMELRNTPLPPDVLRWVERLPPLPPPREPRYSPDALGLRAWQQAQGLTTYAAARHLQVTATTLFRWYAGQYPPPGPIQVWLSQGAPGDWWPPDPPPLEATARRPRYTQAAPDYRHPRVPNTRRPGRGWVWLPWHGWGPPGGYCVEGRDFDQQPGCRLCAWRAQCREIAGAPPEAKVTIRDLLGTRVPDTQAVAVAGGA